MSEDMISLDEVRAWINWLHDKRVNTSMPDENHYDAFIVRGPHFAHFTNHLWKDEYDCDCPICEGEADYGDDNMIPEELTSPGSGR